MPSKTLLPVVAFGVALVVAALPGQAAAHYASDNAPARIVMAANADNPYGNIDRRNDKGNDTGDSKVDQLNAGQLNRNYTGPDTDRPANATPEAPAVTRGRPAQ